MFFNYCNIEIINILEKDFAAKSLAFLIFLDNLFPVGSPATPKCWAWFIHATRFFCYGRNGKKIPNVLQKTFWVTLWFHGPATLSHSDLDSEESNLRSYEICNTLPSWEPYSMDQGQPYRFIIKQFWKQWTSLFILESFE